MRSIEEPLITVYIPVYNGARCISDAIESVLNQSFNRWLLVICDNNSSDGTDQVVRRYCDADERVSFLPSPTNVGMAGNFTRCLNSVKTPYFMILSHDDFFFSPHALNHALGVVSQISDVVAVYSNLVWVDGRKRPLRTIKYGNEGLLDGSQIAKQSIVRARNLFGIPLLMRTDAAAGLTFDPTLPYIIDLDFSIALSRGGKLKNYRIPEELVAYRYDGFNATALLLHDVAAQLTRMAEKHGIFLTAFDRIAIRCNAWMASLLKRGFTLYVKRLRR
jgi:glycosyltransferase involved in cell wall biosynthesis